MSRYLAIILACFATEHEESKQAAKQEAKKTSVRPDFSAAYKRASAKWKSSKLCVQAEGQGSSSSLVRCSTSGRLSAVAVEAAASSGVGLNARLARRTSSPLSGHGSAARQEAGLEAGAAPKEGSAAKKPRKPMERKSTERQSTSGRARPPPAPKPEEMMSEDQAALALQNKWRQHEARVLAKSMREYRSEVQLRNSRVASYNDPLHLDVSVPVYIYMYALPYCVCVCCTSTAPCRCDTTHTHTHTHTHAHTHSCICMCARQASNPSRQWTPPRVSTGDLGGAAARRRSRGQSRPVFVSEEEEREPARLKRYDFEYLVRESDDPKRRQSAAAQRAMLLASKKKGGDDEKAAKKAAKAAARAAKRLSRSGNSSDNPYEINQTKRSLGQQEP